MYPDLYLMRHGQTEWNLAGKMQGRLDSPLTELGIAQARRQAQLVTHITAERYSSPQGRAVRTAEIAFGKLVFKTDSRLCEIDTGEFTGHSIRELQQSYPEAFKGKSIDWYDRTPQGENFAQLSARCQSFMDDLTGPALVVTHGITLRMLCALALGMPLARLAEFSVEQGAVHVVRKAAHEVWR